MGSGVSKPVKEPVTYPITNPITDPITDPITELDGEVAINAFWEVIRQYGSWKEVINALNAHKIQEEAIEAAKKALNTPEGQASARKARKWIAERAAGKQRRKAARNAPRFATAANMRF